MPDSGEGPKAAPLTPQLQRLLWDFPGGSAVKKLPEIQETQVGFLGREDSPGGMAAHSSILALSWASCVIQWLPSSYLFHTWLYIYVNATPSVCPTFSFHPVSASPFFISTDTYLYFVEPFVGFPCGSDGKESTCNAGDLGWIPELGRSPGGGRGNTLQYSCLKNPHGQRNLAGYIPCDCKESDTTEWLSTHTHRTFCTITSVFLIIPLS